MRDGFDAENDHLAEIKYLANVRGRFARAGITKMPHLSPPCDKWEEVSLNHAHSALCEDVADWTNGDDEARLEWVNRMANGDAEIAELLLDEIECWERFHSEDQERICKAILDGTFFMSEWVPQEMPD